MRRRRAMQGLLAASGAVALARALVPVAGHAAPPARPPSRRIEMVARRFAFLPGEVAVRAGERVTLVLTAMDFPHGFSVPDLGRRADLVPGQPVELELAFGPPGVVEFVCDNFCGNQHEAMHGRFLVD